MTDWTWDGNDYSTAYARTDDPRVLAIIRRDDYPSAPDGDALAPTYWDDGGRAGDVYYDDESDEIAEAYDAARRYFVNWHYGRRDGHRQLDYDTLAARYLRIFHGAEVAEVDSTIHQGHGVRIFDTPGYRAHVGAQDIVEAYHVASVTGPGQGMARSTHVGTEAQARAAHLAGADGDARRWITATYRVSSLEGDVAEWRAYLDGDVFGVGYAVRESQVLPAEEIDLADWDVEVEVWGFYGEEYAQGEALAVATAAADLEPLLPLEETP